MTARDKQLNIRISAAEKRWLETTASERGISVADVVRLGIRRAYDDMVKDRDVSPFFLEALEHSTKKEL